MTVPLNEVLVFYDGVCNLCHASVQWILKHERNQDLRFAALQSDLARNLLPSQFLATGDPDSLVFYSNGKVFAGSDAALEIAPYLKQPWRFLRVFRFVPKGIRDAVYFYIARNRYRWFGKQDSCMVPTPEIRQRFADFSAEKSKADH
jgi:predicted DCC family thiol-disulfide oxidoreductase YuxK